MQNIRILLFLLYIVVIIIS